MLDEKFQQNASKATFTYILYKNPKPFFIIKHKIKECQAMKVTPTAALAAIFEKHIKM